MSETQPIIEIKQFHKTYPNLPLLYHTYCSACPEYGVCEEWDKAAEDSFSHAQTVHDLTVTFRVARVES